MSHQPLVITVYLSKGGVGKTTLVALLAWFLAALGYRVVIIDLDRQGSQSAVFDLLDDTGRGGEVLHQVLKRRLDILSALTPVPELPRLPDFTPGSLHVAQGGPQTMDAIGDIAANPVRYRVANPNDIVRGPIHELNSFADIVLLDMGPGDQRAVLAGLAATDCLLIPTKMDFLSVMRIAPSLEDVAVAQQVNPNLRVVGIVPMVTNYYFGGLHKSHNVQAGEDFLTETYGDLLLKDNGQLLDLPYREEVHKAMWAGVPLLSDKLSRPARLEMLRLLNGLVARIGIREVAHV